MLPTLFSGAMQAIRGLQPGTSFQAVRAARGALSYGMQQAAGSAQPREFSNKPENVYVYQPPGSSMREPGYPLHTSGHSLSESHYELADPKPRKPPVPFPGNNKPPSAAAKPTINSAHKSGSSKAPGPQNAGSMGNKQQAPPAPYVYNSPGSSITEAAYGFSMKDPVYVVDPTPSSPVHSPASPAAQSPAPAAPAPAGGAARSRVGLPTDDLAQASYVSSPRGSMREPRYISLTDPQDAADRKAQQQQQANGAGTNQQRKERIGLQPDDLSSQHYVTSASGSMRDPRYISITPP